METRISLSEAFELILKSHAGRRKTVPLSKAVEVIAQIFDSQAETIPLEKAVEILLKSDSKKKFEIVAGLVRRLNAGQIRDKDSHLQEG